jgi:hypothetical protein
VEDWCGRCLAGEIKTRCKAAAVLNRHIVGRILDLAVLTSEGMR